jgi:membrane fusion protein, multidrug efflux system
MKPRTLWIAAAAALVVTIACAFFAYRAGSFAGAAGAAGRAVSAPPPEVTAAVAVVPIKEGILTRAVDAFGSVVPAPGALFTLSVPFDCRVDRVLVSEGQAVSKGMLLLSVSGSPDAKLALDQADAEAAAARDTLRQVQERHGLKLADDAALAQARGVADAAEARLKSLQARRLDGPHDLSAPADGIVYRLPFSRGASVTAGTSLADVADGGALEARFGVEPSERGRFVPGSAVTLQAVDGGGAAPVAGRIRAVSTAINPATRLVDVYVALARGNGLALGAYLKGSFTAASTAGLVVPYSAVMPWESGFVLFTVKDGRAVRHAVTVTTDNGEEAAVAGAGLAAGDLAVVTGNYELEDGMAVRVETGP